MKRSWMWGVAVAGTMLALPSPVSAQMQSMQDVLVSDIENLRDKFAGLAEAFDESDYDWRPMEGVRSVREVLALAVAEATMFPTSWGYDPPAGSAQGFGAEMARVQAMGKAEVVRELRSAYDHWASVVRGMDRDTRMRETNQWGRTVSTSTAVMMALTDTHEHLGQLIAYARTNHVVPPWSRGGE